MEGVAYLEFARLLDFEGGWYLNCQMQLLTEATEQLAGLPLAASAQECARQILYVAPRMVREIRRLMRNHRLSDLSVPQFRALGLLSFWPHASLSILADHVGTSLPAASRMVDGLVTRKLVARKVSPKDRRQVSLALTARGASAFRASREAAAKQLSKQLDGLSTQQKRSVIDAMQILAGIYGADADAGPNGPKKEKGAQ
jgi:DNA-binding MarR family transcriptional regulator